MNPTAELDFQKLPKYQERRFVAADANLKDQNLVVSLYQNLLDRPVKSGLDLEKWLMDRSELESAVSQEGDILYIRMTCQTDDPARSDAYKHFIETIVPAVKPLEDHLNKRYVILREQFPSGGNRYEVYDRAIHEDINLFRAENIPLSTQIQLLSQEYQTISGAMTVQFEGAERTLPEMSKYQQQTDRGLRERAFQATAERRIQDRAKLDELFDKMLKLRIQAAKNAGFKNFMEFQFRAYHRFDYTPAECKQYHQAVAEVVIPVVAKIYERRQQQMKLASVRPWDTQVDPLGRPPLKPFEQVHSLIKGTGEIFNRLDPDLGHQFQEMADRGLLDLASRKGKAPGGYQNTLAEARKPFIFMNAVGVDDDVRTLLHEGGHAFHAFASAHDPIRDYRHAPMEFCEVASMSMELMGGEYLKTFYNEEDLARSKQAHLEDVVQLLAWVANIDAFQHWIYEHPDHTREERTRAWVEIYQRFGGQFLDWSGLEKYRESLWHRQLHIFEVPFYYIEYGIAQLGAVQLFLNFKKDPRLTINQYRQGLTLGGSRPLPELFTAAGLKFDFSAKTIAPLVEGLARELGLG